jgi:uncharacterized protein with HEPN domain
MRREPAFLNDIYVAASRILSMTQGVSRAELLHNHVLQGALLHNFAVIGEAVNRLPEDLLRRYPSIPWADVVGLRNRVVHEYFGLDWNVLWAAAADDVPMLRQVVTDILAQEFGEQPPEASE